MNLSPAPLSIGDPGSMYSVFPPKFTNYSRTAPIINSSPLSERICPGTFLRTIAPAKISITPEDFMC